MSKEEKKERKSLPPWAKVIIKIIKILWIPVFCIAALFGGLIIGYVYIGDKELADVFKWDTWKHVYDLVFSDA
jgi:hypothetical protein